MGDEIEEDGRLELDDTDPELAAFLAGDDLSAPLVPDGGKGLVLNDDEEA